MDVERMDAPNIRWSALAEHGGEPQADSGETGSAHDGDGAYGLDTFGLAVSEGVYPDGEQLGGDMPRWEMTDADLQDLVEYLQSLTAP